ncbi:hypothetical protein [Antrihabitans cavernicola]|uniref:Sensor domain-containing protein n=1 Tax=Antrihabitans cavernicola TaxID=2495913 RepID=A0A5A7SHP4_9NOCA|nr:hypothetical protein [Spelaeibacter cavernicola]KAA0024682.1 hypothetical protein FOY51_01695 [Spelaeibacter cavernicola]
MYRHRKALLVCLAAAATVPMLASCDSESGIPAADVHHDAPAVTASQSATAEPSTTSESTTTTQTAPAAPVGEVPTNAAASAALQPWVNDLVTNPSSLAAKCWTISPLNTSKMYADQQAILAAVAKPGKDGQFAVTWTGPTQTVSVKRSEISSGYACPYVYPTGTQFAYNDADARHTVRRYLARQIGKPVNADDVESKYPLVCDNSATWDPDGTGQSKIAPLRDDPDKLTGVTGYTDSELTSQPGRLDYVTVSVPVQNSSGVTASKTFTLRVGSNGYCIGDVV